MKTLRLKIIAALVMFSLNAVQAQWFTEPLNIMDTMSGPNYNLTFQNGIWQFYSGVNTGTLAYNGNVLGPTLIMNEGDSVHITVTNTTSEVTSTHWHGFHVPANVDGTHYNAIQPGETWTPSFKIMNKAATYWYHPHLYGTTNRHVSKGASGMIIVRDEEEATKDLPRTYGVDDFPLVIQSKIINPNNGQIVLTGPFDSTMTVNGVVKPYLEVPAQPVRFRMLNGASRRNFMIGLSDDRNYHQIATDGSLTPEPREMNRVFLGNGERSEIVVDFTGQEDSTYYLMCYGTELGAFVPGGATGGGGMGANPYDSADYAIMRIDVVEATNNPVPFDPNQTLTTIEPWDENDADTTRQIVFSGGLGEPFIFGDTVFLHNVINQVVPLGNIEIWELVNTTFLTHPFHVHDVQFQILDIDDGPVPIAEQGLKDVVNVPAFGSARIMMQFLDFFNPDTAYMYHCHNLAHEDEGMMAQFVVVDTTSSVVTNIQESDRQVAVYPNPADVFVQLQGVSGDGQFILRDMLGRVVLVKQVNGNSEPRISVSDIVDGVYSYSLELINEPDVLGKLVIRHPR